MKKDIPCSFNKNIEVIDKCRFYRWTYSFRPSAGIVNQLRLAKMVDNELGKYDKSLWKRVQKESEEIGNPIKFTKSDKNYNFLFYIFFIFIFFLMMWVTFLRSHPDFSQIMLVFLMGTIGMAILFPAIIFKVVLPRSKRSIQKSFEQKKLVQDLINSAIDYFKKENIDPEKYLLKLKFNDYVGLNYVKEKKYLKKYYAYLNLEGNYVVEDATEEEIDKISSKPTFIFIKGTVIILVIMILLIIIIK